MAIYNILSVVLIVALVQVITGQGYEGRRGGGRLGRVIGSRRISQCPHGYTSSQYPCEYSSECGQSGYCADHYCCYARHITSGVHRPHRPVHRPIHRPHRPISHSSVGHVSRGSDHCTHHSHCPHGYECCSGGYCAYTCPHVGVHTPRRTVRRRGGSIGGVFPVNY